MDPQQRLLLERGYSALHAAGMSTGALIGAVVMVSVGQWASEYGSVLGRIQSCAAHAAPCSCCWYAVARARGGRRCHRAVPLQGAPYGARCNAAAAPNAAPLLIVCMYAVARTVYCTDRRVCAGLLVLHWVGPPLVSCG